MIMQKKTLGRLLSCCAVGALTMAPLTGAHAMDDMTSGSMMSDSMMQPMQVSGTVLRYYVDRSGYVTAMDVQTADGVKMVRFAPGMGQRLYANYPVGGQAAVWVTGSDMMGMTRYDVVGMGETMPAGGMMKPMTMATDLYLLNAEPWIMANSDQVQFTGTLKEIVIGETGEVLGLVLDGVKLKNAKGMMKKGMMKKDMAMEGGAMGGSTMMSDNAMMMDDKKMGDMMMGDMMMGKGEVLVRVPRASRHVNPGGIGTRRVTPLFRGAKVEVVGYPEAPMYGTISQYNQRVAANVLVVNGRAVGAVGIPAMDRDRSRSLLNFNIGGSDEEKSASSMGYRTYDPGNTGASAAPNADSMGTSGSM